MVNTKLPIFKLFGCMKGVNTKLPIFKLCLSASTGQRKVINTNCVWVHEMVNEIGESKLIIK